MIPFCSRAAISGRRGSMAGTGAAEARTCIGSPRAGTSGPRAPRGAGCRRLHPAHGHKRPRLRLDAPQRRQPRRPRCRRPAPCVNGRSRAPLAPDRAPVWLFPPAPGETTLASRRRGDCRDRGTPASSGLHDPAPGRPRPGTRRAGHARLTRQGGRLHAHRGTQGDQGPRIPRGPHAGQRERGGPARPRGHRGARCGRRHRRRGRRVRRGRGGDRRRRGGGLRAGGDDRQGQGAAGR